MPHLATVAAAPPTHHTDLQRLISDRVALWSTLADEHDIGIVANVTGHPTVASEEGRIEQVLDNLLANALDASPAGTTITIQAFPANGQIEIHVPTKAAGCPPNSGNVRLTASGELETAMAPASDSPSSANS